MRTQQSKFVEHTASNLKRVLDSITGLSEKKQEKLR